MADDIDRAWHEFLEWERINPNRVDFNLIYVDIAGDLHAGLLLSQIMYWYRLAKDGTSKLRVQKDGHFWIARNLDDWWAETRLTKKQVRRALRVLCERGVVIRKDGGFAGRRVLLIRLNWPVFYAAWRDYLGSYGLYPDGGGGHNPARETGTIQPDGREQSYPKGTTDRTQRESYPKGTINRTQRVRPIMPKGYDRSYPKGTTDRTQRARSNTETTTETTTEITTETTTETTFDRGSESIAYKASSVEFHGGAQVQFSEKTALARPTSACERADFKNPPSSGGDMSAAKSRESIQTPTQTTMFHDDTEPALKPEGKRKGTRTPPPPQVAVFRAVTKRYPPKQLYDRVCQVIGEHTADDLKPYYEAWLVRGYNPVSLIWLLEWFAKREIPAWGNGRSGGNGYKPDRAEMIKSAVRLNRQLHEQAPPAQSPPILARPFSGPEALPARAGPPRPATRTREREGVDILPGPQPDLEGQRRVAQGIAQVLARWRVNNLLADSESGTGKPGNF